MELKLVGRDDEQCVEELTGLQDCGVRVGAVILVVGEDGGDGGLQFGVDERPEGGKVHGGGSEHERAEDHVYFAPCYG